MAKHEQIGPSNFYKNEETGQVEYFPGGLPTPVDQAPKSHKKRSSREKVGIIVTTAAVVAIAALGIARLQADLKHGTGLPYPPTPTAIQ